MGISVLRLAFVYTEARNDIPDDEKESIEIETEVYVPKSELRTIEKVAVEGRL